MLGGEQTTVGLLAEVAGLSQARFSHLFFLQTGILTGAQLELMRRFRREQLLAIAILGKGLCGPTARKDKYGKPKRSRCRLSASVIDSLERANPNHQS